MGLQSISYDLSKPGRNYEALIKAIKDYGGWCHALESTWLVSTTKTSGQVRDDLMKHVDANDHLLVTALTGDWATYNLGTAQSDWLKKTA